ncbi:NADP-dependent oxidoreductase [Amnibacterium setariae]|uniref:NADP-dependent oxidoreductase n=1 Tax=Amnibacterium setariae TaxID=2306585 RepID=A0A3A1U0F9_9MICO|nr:NADP-dependent oxidoreductase [Amnibacterium setariae]RIX29991.1 NADP-dependent oxidoreductase [Amnibacterium setariae]
MRAKTALVASFDDYGTVDRLSIETVPRPEPGPGEVLVQVVASGVSHMDAYVREGRFRDALPLSLPSRQGVSFAGIVRAVGPGVRGVAVGAEVLGHDPAHGAHATHLVVDAGAVVRRPPRMPWEVAGALYLVGLTAYTLVQELRLHDGDVVLVSAAAGGVGHIECQLARLAGARVIGIAGRENHDYLRSIGVRPVAYGDDLEEEIRRAAEGRDVTALLDNYGDYDALARRLGIAPERIRTSDRRREVEIGLWTAGPDRGIATRLADVAELVAEWNLRVLVSGFYPFISLAEALTDLDARHSRGVVVVGMDTTAPPREYLKQKLRARYEQPAVDRA